MFQVRRALVSVSDKSDLIPFVTGLAELGVEILSTGGTAKQLRDAGIGGTARVWFLIDETGSVADTRIQESSGHQAIDEAALREGLPLRKADWAHYLDWAVECFRITAAGERTADRGPPAATADPPR